MAKSKKPKGLDLVRDHNKFTASWKGSYKKIKVKQVLVFDSKEDKQVIDKDSGNEVTIKDIDLSKYFPNTSTIFKKIKFVVKGKQGKKSTSAWSEPKDMEFKTPKPPVVTFERSSLYSTAFTIDLPQYISDREYWATRIEFRTVLRLDKEEVNASDIPNEDWGPISSYVIYDSVTQTDTTNFAYDPNNPNKYPDLFITESDTASIVNAKNAVRWFEARVVGPPGPSEWVAVSLSYSEPYPAIIKEATVAPNSRRGTDCTIKWEYQHSISNPINSMSIQYAFASPQGVYIEYAPTKDFSIVSGKTYYKLTGTRVTNPNIDDIYKYYRVVALEPDPDPDPSVLPRPVLFERTTDLAIDLHKTYYTVEPEAVLNPTIEELRVYYHDIVDLKEIAPVSPSWEEAEIGGDNTVIPFDPPKELTTYEATVAFSLDTEIPEDQLLYVRVGTTYHSKNVFSKYYLCTDTNGKIINVDTVLAMPSEPVLSEVSGNHIHVETSNSSEAVGVYIAIVFIPNNSDDGLEVIGVYEPDANGDVSETVEIPPNYSGAFGIGAYAFIGDYILSSRITSGNEGYNLYTIIPILKSKMNTFGADIPNPPTNVEANHIGDGNVEVTWDWNWKEADSAEIAWSDYSDALDSNSQPSTYEVPNSKTNRIIIRSLELGKTWYFWVRLKKGENSSIWSTVVFENLSSSPSIPSLALSKRYVNISDTFTASWTYVSTDGTTQKSASICLCDKDGVISGEPIAQIPNNEQKDPEVQYVVLNPTKLGWEEGNDYYLTVQVTSDSGMISEKWSDPVQISTIPPINSILGTTTLYPQAEEYDPTNTYSEDSYVIKRIPDPDDSTKELGLLYKCITDISEPEEWNCDHWIVDENQTNLALQSLPLEVNVNAEDNITSVSVIIERSKNYFLDRPDGDTYGGYAGEIIFQKTSGINEEDENSNYSFLIDQSDLVNYLDDGAYYYLITRVGDNYDQIHEVKYEFVVNWTHQALRPVASIEILNDYEVPKITIGTPTLKPGESIEEGDVCDIYRKSADGYDLLYSGCSFEESYIDPYPTLGDHGGYRVVYRTKNGDYIKADSDPAWLDFEDDIYYIKSPSHIIDFGEDSVNLMYNVNIDNNWHKDFQETHYLGGSINGDWNEGVSRTLSMSVNVLSSDLDTLNSMRDLASYEGECHVRTRDGANFIANVEVSEKSPYEIWYTENGDKTKVFEYSISITRLDPIESDGLTYDDWLDTLPEEEEETEG